MLLELFFFQLKLPNFFWSYVVLHAVFLINRVPTLVLENKSPYQVLYKTLPDINSFKVFGCLCYASTLQSHRTKLQSRARKSVFLGYKSGYKGSFLYDLNTKEIFMSRNVTFHESILPYNSTNTHFSSNWQYFTPSHTQTPFVDVPVPSTFPSSPIITPSSPLPLRTSSRTRHTLAYLHDY